jgi:hypothetical protein
MAPTKKLSTQVKEENKFIAMATGRLSLRPKRTRTVQTADGQFSTIEDAPLFYEREGDRRNGRIGRPLNPNVARDKEILDLTAQLLEEKPWMATDIRYQIEIIGEFEATLPWRGYDTQSAADAKATYYALPEESRPDLERMMKYEMERKEWDEHAEEYVSTTDNDKVEMINGLYRDAEKAQKIASTDTVDLA